MEDFEGGPAVWPKYVSSDGYMITYLYAHEFKAHAETHKVSDKFKRIAETLKDTDNPVIVRVKLKNNHKYQEILIKPPVESAFF